MASLSDLTTAKRFSAVSPSDTTRFEPAADALYIGVGGNVSLRPPGGGTSVVFLNVAPGTVLPVSFSAVNATSTTATNMVALFT